MVQEIINRINEIALNGAYNGETLGVQGLGFPPATLEGYQLPALIALPKSSGTWQTSGAIGNYSDLLFELRFYLARVGGNQKLDISQLYKYEPLARRVFLSRPRLQHNDSGLSLMGGEISYQVTSDLARLMSYPYGGNDTGLYWGFIVRLTVPYRDYIQENINGV